MSGPLSARLLLVGLVALVGVAVGCADEAVAPEQHCSDHSHCPSGWLCGPAGTCVIATPCEDTAGCCPGASCLSGWCRPMPECGPTDACSGLDRICEAALCAPSSCSSSEDCHPAHHCLGGRCLADDPCGGCGSAASCHLPSARCLSTPGCFEACPAGTFRAVAEGEEVDPLVCGGLSVACTCVPRPELPPPHPGYGGRLVPTPLGPTSLSHDPRYGDLVLSVVGAAGPILHRALDGVPVDATLSAPADGYRGGVAEPGPRRGESPAAIATVVDGQARVDVLYRDGDLGSVRHLRLDGATGQPAGGSLLPVEGEAGRYTCLVADPVDGRMTGWVYVDPDPTGTQRQLVRVKASSDLPVSPSGWAHTVMLQTPRPPASASPCEGTCAIGELCVRDGVVDRCASALDALACAAPCASGEACAGPADTEALDAEASCLPRVRVDLPELPAEPGRGAYVSCAATSTELVVAWYDPPERRAEAIVGPGGVGPIEHIDLGEGRDVGAHIAVAVAQGGVVWAAYQDRSAGRLLLASRQQGGQWASEVVHDVPTSGGREDLGAWASLVIPGDGQPLLAYGHGSSGDIWLARRSSPGCFARVNALSDGVFAFPALIVDGAGLITLAALRFTFDGLQAPNHGLVSLQLPLPNAATCR